MLKKRTFRAFLESSSISWGIVHIINLKLSIISSRTREIEQRFDLKQLIRDFRKCAKWIKANFVGFILVYLRYRSSGQLKKMCLLHTLDDGWQWMGIICREINFSLTFVLATYTLVTRATDRDLTRIIIDARMHITSVMNGWPNIRRILCYPGILLSENSKGVVSTMIWHEGHTHKKWVHEEVNIEELHSFLRNLNFH